LIYSSRGRSKKELEGFNFEGVEGMGEGRVLGCKVRDIMVITFRDRGF
jgi:hypothetical protein